MMKSWGLLCYAWVTQELPVTLTMYIERVLWERSQKEMGSAWNVLQVCYLVSLCYSVMNLQNSSLRSIPILRKLCYNSKKDYC